MHMYMYVYMYRDKIMFTFKTSYNTVSNLVEHLTAFAILHLRIHMR